MIYSGLVSVTFRSQTPHQIALLVAEAGLDGIEWGGDVHVPSGDAKAAREAGQLTRDHGLAVASYGSYYRLCKDGRDAGAFQAVLETALALGAPNIRVWAGTKASRDADDAWRSAVAEESRRIASLAEREGITVSYEYHSGTLTDTRASVLSLLTEVKHGNIRTYWQPSVGQDISQCLAGLEEVKPWLSNLHVYQWAGHERLPLAEGRRAWMDYLTAATQVLGDRYALLEFVKDDDPEQFLADSAALKDFISQCL